MSENTDQLTQTLNENYKLFNALSFIAMALMVTSFSAFMYAVATYDRFAIITTVVITITSCFAATLSGIKTRKIEYDLGFAHSRTERTKFETRYGLLFVIAGASSIITAIFGYAYFGVVGIVLNTLFVLGFVYIRSR